MINVRGLCYSYHDDQNALDDMNFHVKKGELVCLAGVNGSGKSTLLSILSGIFTPDSGVVTVGGFELPRQEKEIRRITGLVLQDPDVQILGGTVCEDLLMGKVRPGKDQVDQARAMAGKFGLGHSFDKPVQNLSYGQKRKLCLASQALFGPEVMLMDEPFSNLDYPAQKQMRAILRDNKDGGMTQIVSTHELEPVADLADRVMVISKGRLVLEGAPSEVMDHIEKYGIRPPCSWLIGRELAPWD